MTLRWFGFQHNIDPPIDEVGLGAVYESTLASVIPDGAALRRSILQYHLITDPVNIDLLPSNWHPWRVQVWWSWAPIEFGDTEYSPFDNGGTAIFAEEVEWQAVPVTAGGENAVLFQSPSLGTVRQSQAQHSIPSRDAVTLSLNIQAGNGSEVPLGWPFLNARGWMSWRYLVEANSFL